MSKKKHTHKKKKISKLRERERDKNGLVRSVKIIYKYNIYIINLKIIYTTHTEFLSSFYLFHLLVYLYIY